MAACEEQSFPGITDEHVRMFLAKAEQFGIAGAAAQGNSGEATRSGFTVRWAYRPESATLTVQCTGSPMLVPCGLINGKIREAVAFALRPSGESPQAAQEQV